jgi:hypothetical protein
MKNKTFTLWSLIRRFIDGWQRPAVTASMLLLVAGNASAQTQVLAFSGGSPTAPYYGYVNGPTLKSAKFYTPCGLAIDSGGQDLFVADRDNNAIRLLDLVGGQTYTLAVTYTNLINKPVAVAIDASGEIYVLNRGTGKNGSLYTFNCNLYSPNYGQVFTNAVGLTNAAGMSLDSSGNIYLTIQSNKLIRIPAFTTNRTTIATITNAGTLLQGIVAKHNGLIAACDSGRNGIYLINPTTGVVTTNAGFNGVGDYTVANNISPIGRAMFNQPMGIAEAGDGTLIVSDYGNNRIKAVLATGMVTNIYGVSSNYWTQNSFPGWANGTVQVPDSLTPNVQARLPFGVVMSPDGSLYTSEDYYHLIRKVTGTGLTPPPPAPPAAPDSLSVSTNNNQITLTWSSVTGATNYNVDRSTTSGGPYTTIFSTSGTSYTDTNAISGRTYYYVVVASNAGGQSLNSPEVTATLALPPVPDPQIGYVDFPASSSPVAYTSVFHPVSSFVFNNDAYIVILGAAGSQTFYTYGATSTNGIPAPNSASASAPVGYQDGESPGTVSAYSINPSLPDVTIEAIGEKNDGSPNSAIVQSRFQFVVGNPTITGNNPAQFFISDVTANAHLYYTIDGSTPSPTNGIDLGTVVSPTNVWTVGFSILTNTLFQVVAVRPNYQPSAVVSFNFSATNFVANIISFGFATGEASSTFVASPGQTFYAPVTLSMLPNVNIYSLQFNVTVTNGGPNPGPAITPDAFGFSSMLMKPIPGVSPVVYESIPPAMFVSPLSPINPNPVLLDGSTNFTSLQFTNTSPNLLGVGWVERYGATNLYDTTKQDLIQQSIAHDDIFLQTAGNVIVGGYAFTVPPTATSNQTYQIQIGRPSATSDGIGAPGSDVFIAAPTNGSLAGGVPVNALKNVTVGQLKYIAGSVYPFRWFNAGDFGSSNIVSADVEQVFEAAVYYLNSPAFQAPGSDFFDAMDSCGSFGTLDGDSTDPNFGNYTNNFSSLSVAQENQLFSGDDTTINQIAFGNGWLDVCDVYVTFRRSLDPTLTWYQRFWNNGQLVAQTGNNVAAHISQKTTQAKIKTSSQGPTPTVNPQVNFTAGDFQGSAGQVVQIPITATIFGSYPLTVLMLNLTVEPLDGSPALTSQVQFTQTAPLGTPYTTDSKGLGNYASVWLNSTNAGFTGTVTIGTLTVTIPANATASSAYAVHFDHASASPNGIASFPKQTLTGLVLLSSRTNSTYGDGIPDAWRLRWFGTVNNLLSVSNACPTGDGINNWMKYVAGVDPTVANDFPSVNPRTPVPTGSTTAIHWPTVSGVHYAIQRSSSLFPGTWSPIATNTGTGTDMEFDDNYSGAVKFYRVLIQP